MAKQSLLSDFITPERFAREQAHALESPRGRLLLTSCRSGAYLASKVEACYEAQLTSGNKVPYLERIDFQFSDGESCVRLNLDPSGDDVFLFASLFDPAMIPSVDQNYLALLIAARTFREWGANHVTAVVPYLVYARQDKPTRAKVEPTTAKLMAELSSAAGIDRLICWHPHVAQVHGFYGSTPVDILDPVPLFVEAFKRFQARADVIVVAPDEGAAKFVTEVGRALELPCAVTSKFRPRPEEAMVASLMGEFSNKHIAIILDDMISSGGTIEALTKKLVTDKGITEVYLGASHNLCLERAYGRLIELAANYQLREVVVTNSIPQSRPFIELPFVTVKCLSEVLCRAVNAIHYNRSVSGATPA